MTWFKVDDGLHSHRKVMSIHRSARASAMGLWVMAGSWAAANLTDGFIPAHMVREFGCTTRSATSLVTAGLWIEADGGYQFHAWAEPGRQPTKAEVEASRETERKRKAEYRSRQVSQRDNTVSPNGTPPGVPPGVRTPRPDPSRPDLSSSQVSQSSHRGDARTSDGLDLDKIATELRQPHEWAAKVARNVLTRAGPVTNPTAYVLSAIRGEPQRYQPTAGPPPVNRLCQHGRDTLTCHDCNEQP